MGEFPLDLDMLIGVFGGLGLFLYGMQTLSDGLQKVAGNRFRSSWRC